MRVTTLTNREFNQDTVRAQSAAREGPVFITDRGQLAYVLLSIEDYQRLTGGTTSIVDLLADPSLEDIEFDPPRATGFTKPADLA